MKKVAIMIPHLEIGGAGMSAAKLSRTLCKHHDVTVILFQNGKIDYEIGGDLFVIYEPSRRRDHWTAALYRRVKKVREWKRKEQIDVVISFMESASLVNILSRRGEKVIVSVRRYDRENHNTMERLRLGLIYRLYHFADKVVVVSKLLKAEMIKSYGIPLDRIEVIYNYYNIEKICTLAKAAIDEHLQEIFRGPVVVTAGRLVRQKGQWHLVRAFRAVVDSKPDAKLIVLGSGELEGELLRLVRDLHLEKNAFLLGHQDNPFRYIARSTMFVLCSLYEGFPNALCEAMACGVPVISTDCRSGPREILSPNSDYCRQARRMELVENGILVPALDGKPCSAIEALSSGEQALVDAIKALLSDKKTRQHYIQRSRQRSAEFCEEKASERWTSII